MSRKDIFHDAVRQALEKDGWRITHDSFTIQISEAVKLKIALGKYTDRLYKPELKKATTAWAIASFPPLSSFILVLGWFIG